MTCEKEGRAEANRDLRQRFQQRLAQVAGTVRQSRPMSRAHRSRSGLTVWNCRDRVTAKIRRESAETQLGMVPGDGSQLRRGAVLRCGSAVAAAACSGAVELD